MTRRCSVVITTVATLVATTLSTWEVSTAHAQEHRIVVDQALGAESDVYDTAVVGERILAATSGGLVIVRNQQVERVITSAHGLPGNRLRSVSVTRAGVWLGGIEGLALATIRSDGNVQVVRTFPVRRAQRVVQWQGAHWVATAADGLMRMTDRSHDFRQVELSRSRRSLQVSALSTDDSVLWVATVGAGMFGVNPHGRVTTRQTQAHGLPSNIVWDLHQGQNQTLIATANGVAVMSRGRIDPSSEITASFTTLSVRDVRAITHDGSDVYVGTYGAGVWKTVNGVPVRVGSGSDGQRVRGLSVVNHHVWVAHDVGLAIWQHGSSVDQPLLPVVTGGLDSSDITAMIPTQNGLWVGTFQHGLARINNDRSIVSFQQAMTSRGIDLRINDLAITRDDHQNQGSELLWVATDRGLASYNGQDFTLVSDPNGPAQTHVTDLHTDSSGTLWVTAGANVHRLVNQQWQRFQGNERVGLTQLHAVTVDQQGMVWAGGLHGLYQINPTNREIVRSSVASGEIPVNWVTSVTVLSLNENPAQETIVAGTYHGGVVFHRNGRWVTEQDPVVRNAWVNPHAIVQENNVLWVGTLETGLMVRSQNRWRAITIADGLPSNDITAIVRADESHVWVATRGGICRVATAL